MSGMNLLRRAVAAAASLLLASCEAELVEAPFEPADTHERYLEALVLLELAETELGRRWISRAEAAMNDPLEARLPFTEELFFDPASPDAVGYRFAAERGRRIDIVVEAEIDRYFADLFRLEADGTAIAEPVASRPKGETSIVFEPRRDGIYLLRIQPELLRGGRMTVGVSVRAALAFPVKGADPSDIWSLGESRDEGSRRQCRHDL